jgi:hypothetical protein
MSTGFCVAAGGGAGSGLVAAAAGGGRPGATAQRARWRHGVGGAGARAAAAGAPAAAPAPLETHHAHAAGLNEDVAGFERRLGDALDGQDAHAPALVDRDRLHRDGGVLMVVSRRGGRSAGPREQRARRRRVAAVCGGARSHHPPHPARPLPSGAPSARVPVIPTGPRHLRATSSRRRAVCNCFTSRASAGGAGAPRAPEGLTRGGARPALGRGGPARARGGRVK